MPTYRLAHDSEGVLAVFMDGAEPHLPVPLIRECEVSVEAWPLIMAGVRALA